MRHGFPSCFLSILLLWIAAAFLLSPALVHAQRTLRVGIYDFKPLVHQDEQGRARGIYVDLLNAISRQEDWTPAYVHCNWPQCLEWLGQGRIDLLTGILRSPERAEQFDFSEVSVLSTWGQLYAAPGEDIQTFRDLEGKSIAVVEKGYFYPKLRQHLEEFQVSARFVRVKTYRDVFRLVAQGDVDACSAERVTGLQAEKRLDIRRTPLIYNPKQFLFAAPKGNKRILREIDGYLRQFKKQEGSVYDRALQKHLLGEEEGHHIPEWLFWVLLAGGVLLVFALAQSLHFRQLVRNKTAQLRQREQDLELTLHSIGDAVLATDARGLVLRMNPVAEALTGWSFPEAKGRPLSEVFRIVDAVTGEPSSDPVQRVFQSGATQGLANHTVLVSRQGEKHHISDSAAPIRDGQGRVTGAVMVFRDVTESYRMRVALQASENRYRELFENMSSCVAVYRAEDEGRDFEIVGFNAAAEEAERIDREEVLGKRVSQVFPGVASFGLLEVLQRVYLSGAPEHHPVAQYRDERIAGWRENYVYRLASGEVVALYDDVSERKRMEEALRESEQKYRSLFQNIRDAILLADTDRRIIDCNPAFESLFGYSLEEIQGKKTSYVYESDSQFRELGRALREHYDDSSFLMTVQYKKKSGEVFPGETGAFYLKDSAGEVAGFIGVIRDVTDRQQAEEALRKREEHLQAILQAAPDPLVVYDRVGHPQYINPSFTRIFGWTFQELQGQRIPFVPEDQKEATMAKIREIYRTGVPVTFDTKRWTKDERLLDIRVSAAIIQSSREEHHGLVVILTDITERKQLEKRLTELSLYDSLTGLYNRTFFQEEIQRLEDDRYFPMGIIVCDINGLKLINDTLGHDKGDELLRAAADILRQCFRQSDILARIGGDEFTVLLPNSGEEIVQACCRRIREEVGRFNQQSAGFGISLALGYAVDQAPPTDLEGLFKRADDAMYKEKLQQSHSSRNETVQALIKTLEERDHITEGHAGRLNEYAQKLGRLAGLSADRLQDLQLLARFHDLGKVGIPDFILFKPGPLTREEFQEMKRHCEIGHRIALSLNDLAPIADYILKHHEHWDGRGYPLGLSGEDIPLECRILAIVDAYDTMIHKRPYKEPMSHEDAVAELGRCAGTQFDPELVWEFLRIVQESGEG